MGRFIKENYYILVRIMLMLIYSMYGLLESAKSTGVSFRVFLLVLFYISLMTFKELADSGKKLLLHGVLFNSMLQAGHGCAVAADSMRTGSSSTTA